LSDKCLSLSLSFSFSRCCADLPSRPCVRVMLVHAVHHAHRQRRPVARASSESRARVWRCTRARTRQAVARRSVNARTLRARSTCLCVHEQCDGFSVAIGALHTTHNAALATHTVRAHTRRRSHANNTTRAYLSSMRRLTPRGSSSNATTSLNATRHCARDHARRDDGR
jgi:hypothetical protein